jgi:NAD-dependent SIR2 family protein deacetylase
VTAAASTSWTADRIADLHEFVARHPRLFVLTGAGVSTGSGIPGYRDDDGRWKRNAPMTVQEFLGGEAARRRYWARSMAGWPIVAGAHPNGAHRALSQLERAGRIHRLVTQNVDGLHQRAGSAGVVELHGNIGRVVCVCCNLEIPRGTVQRTLEEANPAHAARPATTAPDGDADLEPGDVDAFRVPACPRCGGILKPDVVFFGENVPRDRVDAAFDALEESDAMLVVGSSLMVYSGYRFCERAERIGKPVAAINLGRTRADPLFTLKVEQACEAALGELARRLVPPSPRA